MEEMMEHYYPIEISTTMTKEEKIPYMVEWYAKVNYLLGMQNLNRSDVVAAVAACTDFCIRDGVEEAFGILASKGIPIIIVSAGLGNVIEEVVRQRIARPGDAKGQTWENVRVLSNTMLWDDNGEFMEFSDPLIHMYNKSLQDAPDGIKAMIKGRKSGILCGDGLGDLTMADGSEATTILKYGFLNERIEERLPKYISKQAFDRVILNDGAWDPVLDLLRKL
jgi:5'-nucleotidase